MQSDTIKLLYGGAKTSYHEMNEAEKKQAADEVLQRAREKAFSRGLPIYYTQNKRVIAEFADGRKYVVENQQLVRPYDGE